MSRVSIQIEDHVAHVTLTRPDKINAFDAEMIDAVIAAGEDVSRADVRAVVLSGEGRGFSAGLDVMSFGALAMQDPEGLVMPRSHGDANAYQQVALVWQDLPVPVIAALHGVCYGAGLQCAMGADIRFGSPDLRMAIMEMKWGLVPDMGGMVLWPRLMRADHLRRLTYTAQPIEAPMALDYGLLTEIVADPLSAARDLAAEIAGKSPSAIRAAKRLTDLAWRADRAEVLMAESREQTDLIGKPDMMETIAANMAGRKPVFK
jgi:enoyl-CoA hydratase/carnithine racemase